MKDEFLDLAYNMKKFESKAKVRIKIQLYA